ncbi:hypothetical protein Tco_0237354 [Tanacetum coccineum]
MDEDQARPNPGQSHGALVGPNPEPMQDDFVATVYPKVHESLKHIMEEHVHLENPLSSYGTLSSIKNLDDAFIVGDQFLNYKPMEEDPSKTNMDTKAESMVTVPIHQASTSVPLLSTPIIDLSPPKLVFSLLQELFIAATTEATTTTLPLPPPPQQQSTTDSVGSHKAHPDYASLYHALEISMERDNQEALHATLTTSRKRHRDDQDPPLPPPPKDSNKSKKTRHDSDASASKQPQAQTTAHLPKIKTRPEWLKPVPEEERPKTPEPDWSVPSNDLPKLQNDWSNSLAKTYKDLEENKLLWKTGDMGSFIKWYYRQIGKKKLSKADLEGPTFKIVDLVNPEGHQIVPDVSKPLPLGGPPAYGIAHWWFKRKEFYITRHSSPSDRRAVRSHMRILSVISLNTYEIYSYTYMKEIVLRRADYNDYKISEADFKNMHLNDFKDLYLLHLQGKLNHLPRSDKENEVHKFSDGTLTRVLEKLDHMVKDFVLFKFNPGMENRIWSEDDKRRSKDFIEVIERRLEIKRIFRNLESFVGGRLRDVD